MIDEVEPALRRRMPAHFGPSAGPRQGPDGKRFDGSNLRRDVAAVRFLTDAAAIGAYLPDCFELDGEPIVTMEHTHLKEVDWLAGRSYNVLSVKVPARFRGKRDTARGPFVLVLWEDMTDPILTGREELGFQKLYCELPTRVLRGSHHYSGNWENHTFVRMEISGLEPARPPLSDRSIDGVLNHRYFPAVDPLGASDVEVAVLSPRPENPPVVESFAIGTGKIEFVPTTWEQMPTMYHIVNALASLPVVEYRGASLSSTRGAQDYSDQRVLA